MTEEPADEVQPPPLPDALTDPRPVIAVITLVWLAAVIVAFTVPSLDTWRPITVAGLGLAVFGTSVFLWQRRAARRGSRGAQTGLR
jgi:Protein of unknown function (DUF2530)